MSPSPAPSPRRLVLAALAAAAASYLLGGQAGMAANFSLTLPLLVGAGGWLALRGGDGPLPQAALALLLLVPAVGARLWAQLLVEQDLDHIAPMGLALWLPRAAASCLDGVPALLAGAAAALVVLGARRPALLVALATAAAAATQQQLLWTSAALSEARWSAAAWGGLLASGGCALPLLGFGLRPRDPDRRLVGLWLAAALAAAGLATSPLPRLLGVLPTAPHHAAEVPAGPPGLPTGETAPRLWVGKDAPDPATQLAEAGLRAFPRDRWWCAAPRDRWTRRLRASATLEADADLPLSALAEAIRAVGLYSIHQLALQGRATAPPAPGPLGRRLVAPAARFLLDPAPDGVPRVVADAEGALLWPTGAVAEEGRAACVLVVSPALTVGALYGLGRELGDPGGRCARGLGLEVSWALAPCDTPDLLP